MNTCIDHRWAITPEKVQQAVDLLVATAAPLRVIVFGSYARGENSADSDVDFLVIEKEVPKPITEMNRLLSALSPLCLPVDVLVTDENNFDRWAETPGNVYYDARHEGRVLYAAF